ncbi:MAG TPA: peptidylprolyl isomerase [Gemmatimonadaceae bacterium]|nr:peptidylprolyl isomerase [Gemmatimonadaceae bacterium]
MESRMKEAKAGDTVRVHYTGTLSDGSIFDSSRGRAPLEFTIGSGQVIAGFDEAVAGMHVGDDKKVTIAAEDAYGPRRSDLMLRVDRAQFPEHLAPAVGQQLQLSQENELFVVTVREVTDDSVLLDANHPLAGEDLTFDLELVEIR